MQALRVLRGCAEKSPGASEFAGVEDWGYIRPTAVDEPPFCVRPVTGSHLFSPPLGRVLGGCAEDQACRRGFPGGLGRLIGGLPSPWGVLRGCTDARKGLPARKSLPARLRGRDREGLFRL